MGVNLRGTAVAESNQANAPKLFSISCFRGARQQQACWSHSGSETESNCWKNWLWSCVIRFRASRCISVLLALGGLDGSQLGSAFTWQKQQQQQQKGQLLTGGTNTCCFQDLKCVALESTDLNPDRMWCFYFDAFAFLLVLLLLITPIL